jgi:hypothetical protein
VLRNAQRRRGSRDGGIEHVAQQRSIIHAMARVAQRAFYTHSRPIAALRRDKTTTCMFTPPTLAFTMANSIGFLGVAG